MSNNDYVKNIEKRFGDLEVLKGIFEVNQGDVYAISVPQVLVNQPCCCLNQLKWLMAVT